jgi:hypothetical protein
VIKIGLQRKQLGAIVYVIIVASVALYVLFVGNPFAAAPSSSVNEPYQILFVGDGFNQTNATRNSTIYGSFYVNFSQPSDVKFELEGNQVYYPLGSVENGSTYSLANAFRNGTVSIGDQNYGFANVRDCTATPTLTVTMGNTVREEVTCNSSTVTPFIGTEGIRIPQSGVSQFSYSLKVPSNASFGMYLVDFLLQGQSWENLAVSSNNLVYVLTVNVTG